MLKNKDRNKGTRKTEEKAVQETKETKETRAVKTEVEVSKKNDFGLSITKICERPQIWLFTLLMIFFVIDLHFFSHAPEDLKAVFCLMAIPVFILVLAYCVFILWRYATTKNPCKFSVNGDKFTLETEDAELHRLNRLNYIWERKHYFFFAVSHEDYFIMIRHLLSADEKQSVRTMIEKHVNVKDRILRKDKYLFSLHHEYFYGSYEIGGEHT